MELNNQLKEFVIKNSLKVKVYVENTPDCLVVALNGYLDTYNSLEFQRNINLLMQDNNLPLILDFSNLSHISSAGIAVITKIYKQTKEKNGKIFIASVNSTIMEIFRTIRYTGLIKFTDSVEEVKNFL